MNSSANESLSESLCYFCHTLLTSKSPRSVVAPNTRVRLPHWSFDRLIPARTTDTIEDTLESNETYVMKPMKEDQLRAEIKDFLLEE